MLNKYDHRILEIIAQHSELDLESIKKFFWDGLSEDEFFQVNLGDNVTKLYLGEYIRKSPSYGGYSLTRKGKKYINERQDA